MPATLEDIQKKYGDSVYPLYKEVMHEPYMENDNGGYQGVVLYDSFEDSVRCEECGEWFKWMSPHLKKKHKLTDSEYKDKYGLFREIPLIAKGVSETRRKTAIENNFAERMKSGFKRWKQEGSPRKVSKKPYSKVAYKNKHGLCDAQIAARLIIVRSMSGKDFVSNRDIKKHDINLYQNLCKKYGTAEAAWKALGITNEPYTGPQPKYEDAEIIASLRKFVVENHRLPTTRDWDKHSELGLPSRPTYVNYFGSWRRAKMMAGLDQLLKEINV